MERARKTAAVADAAPIELPRWMHRFGIPLGATLLTLLFVLGGFPWERVAPSIAARLSQALGAQVALGSFAPTLGLLGPGIRASDVRVSWPDGRTLELDALRVRPAWSFSWLRGRPALAIDASGPLGRAVGTAVVAGEPGFDGRVSDLDLAKLPLGNLVPGASLDGHGGADGDVVVGPAGARGALTVEAHDGSIALPNLPVALPYTMLRGEVRMTDTALAEIASLELDGPLLSVRASGTIGRAPVLPASSLDLRVRLEAKDAAVRPLLAQAGLRVGADGGVDLQILGTVLQPVVR